MDNEKTPIQWFIDNMPESLFLNSEVVEKLGIARDMEKSRDMKIYNQGFSEGCIEETQKKQEEEKKEKDKGKKSMSGMATLEITQEQLRLIQRALDFYSRVGIGQMWVIKDHPTFEEVLREKLRPKKELEIGDRTERGDVIEITKKKVKTKGTWNTKEEIREWNRKEVKLSVDYNQYHSIRDTAEKILNQGRNMLLQDELPHNGSYGIYNENVDESCRVAYDLVQVIRHEFWKNSPNRSDITVDSSCYLRTKDCNKIKCTLG